jgi:hypothetical protein
MNRTTMLEKMKKKGVKFDGASRDSMGTEGNARAQAERQSGKGEFAERNAGSDTGDIPDPQRSH